MARKLCVDCNIRRATPESPEGQLCPPCLEYAEAENMHNDDGHDSIEDLVTELDANHYDMIVKDIKNCPVCHPELDPRSDTPRKGHTNTVARSHNSHTGHGHALTPAARAICRKSIAAGNGPWNGAH